MMKKVLYGVAMTLLAGASVGTLQSCKDDVSDLKAQTSFDLGQLKQNLQADIDKKVGALKSELEGQIDGKLDLTELNAILEDYAKKQYVLDKINELENKLTGEGGAITEVSAKLDGYITANDQKIAELSAEDVRLAGEIAGAISSINDLRGELDNYVLKTDFDAFKALVDPIVADYDVLKGRVAANELTIATITTTLDDVKASIIAAEGRLDTVEGKVDAIEVRLTGIDDKLLNLGNDVDGLKTDVAGLQSTVNAINQELAGLTSRVSTVEGDLALTMDNVETLKQKVYLLGLELNQVKSDLANLSADVNTLTQRVNTIEQDLQTLAGRIDDMLSNILIQAADSPVFGNFSLPLGVKSTLLFNWYGDNRTGISEFPVYEYNGEYEYNKERNDFAFPGMAAPVAVMDGIIGNVDLGTVYVTLNPAGHYFNNENFTLETSKGTKLPVTVEVNKSNEELTFGYSRDRQQIEGNGFYAANVKIASDDPAERAKGVMAARIMIDDNLKSAVKNVLKDRNGRSAVNLLKAVYGQLDGMLPAYALRYDWTNGGKNYSVLSNYDLAVATARPLSYNFYKDGSIDKRLHKYGHIDNIVNELKGKFKIEFEPISFDNITISIPPIPLDRAQVVPGTTTVSTTVDPVIVWGTDEHGNKVEIGRTDNIPVTINIDDVVGSIVNDFNAAINDMIGSIEGWTPTANAKIQEDLKGQLQPIADQINNMVNNLQGQIDSMIDDLAGTAQPWFDRLNRVVDIYNRVADKVNTVLEDPNHYLQVAMYYNQKNSGVGMVSNTIDSPTPFGSGNGVITLYASSYSAEIVCPAFMKYVACTNVYDDNAAKTVAANVSELRDAVNAASLLNKPVEGYHVRFDVPVTSLKKGYIYEITYQGLDYSGVTSTQKFYIKVN